MKTGVSPSGSRRYQLHITAFHEGDVWPVLRIQISKARGIVHHQAAHWKTSVEGLARLEAKSQTARDYGITSSLQCGSSMIFRLLPINERLGQILSIGGFDGTSNITLFRRGIKVIERCLLMTTDPGDLVFDPTCGSGTTAFVAEQWGRRWITCDTRASRLTLAKQRLMTAVFDYYELAHPHEGVGSGFNYKTVPHVTLEVHRQQRTSRPGSSLRSTFRG